MTGVFGDFGGLDDQLAEAVEHPGTDPGADMMILNTYLQSTYMHKIVADTWMDQKQILSSRSILARRGDKA